MASFETIDIFVLTHVTGGGSSTDEGQLGVQVPTKAGPVNVGVSGKQSNTDYKTCVDAVRNMPGAKPSDIVGACGLPPSN
jgi:hypothetical protein